MARIWWKMRWISNRLLEYTPDLRRHPFIEYLRFGIPVCLNTDDAGVWDSNLTDEYFTAITTFHMTWKEVAQIGRDSLRYSFLEPAAKARVLETFERRLRAFEAHYAAPRLGRESGPRAAGNQRLCAAFAGHSIAV